MIPNLGALEMLLRIYYDPNGHPDERGADTCSRNAIEWLLKEDLIQVIERRPLYSGGYQPTERARVYIEHIRQLPLPERTWAMPTTARVIDYHYTPPLPRLPTYMDDNDILRFGTRPK